MSVEISSPAVGLLENALSRRRFLKWSGALGGAAALAGGVGVGLQATESQATEEVQGEWIPAACWGDCGGKGFNKAYVVDGTVVRMGTDDTHPDSPTNPVLKSCAKGRALHHSLFHPNRLKYPMKRKNWEPGGGNKELRGKDEWERISWDEALDIVASELKRVKAEHGNEAILANWVGPQVGRMLALFGGFADNWGQHSTGTWPGVRLTGYYGEYNDRLDLANTKLFIMWGKNPAWSRAGNPTYQYHQYKKAGARFIFIDPFFNPTAQVLADDWIPIRPGTDHTLVLGMIHTLLVEDDPESNPLIDWDLLNRCTVGFDADHMPEGVDPEENFRDYVLGTYDGIPKTAEWAAEICGVPATRIRSLAREIATTRDTAICMTTSGGRVNNSDSWPQAALTLGFVTGHVGRSGSMCGHDGGHKAISGGSALVKGGWILNQQTFARAEPVGNPLSGGLVAGIFGDKYTRPKEAGEPGTVLFSMNETWDAIDKGEYTAGYNDKRPLNIQLIYHAFGSRINQLPGTMKAIDVHRKVEFVVTQNLYFNPDAAYSDIVLPVTSQWERIGNLSTGYREQILWTSQIVEPYFESRDDIWIAREVGKRLGLDEKQLEPWPLKQELMNNLADAKVVGDDGQTMEPLLTITQRDLDEYDVEGTPQTGKISLEEFKQRGIYTVQRKQGDNLGAIPLKAFREDPEANPLPSQSGKFEIHCQALADYVKSCGWTEISPIPKYNPPVEGYEDTFSDWDNKVKGDYPLQKMDLHVLRRTHSTFEDSPWLREVFEFQFMMNPLDAEERGIKDQDTVLVSSRHGKILRIVSLSPRIMPGVVALSEGSWVDIDEETGIDRGGCSNVLSGAVSTGQGHMGYNTCNVQVEKWTGEPLIPDSRQMPSYVMKES